MNRHILSAVAALSMALLLGACNEEKKVEDAPKAQAEPQVAVVQLAKIYQESQLGKKGVARVGDVQAKATAAFEALQSKLEKARADKKEDEAAKLEKQMQALAYFLQNAIKQDQEHVMNVVQTALTKALDAYRTEHKLAGIVSAESMLSFDPRSDATAGVLAVLDKDASDFGPLPSLEMPAEPASAAASASAPAKEDKPAPVQTGEKPVENAPAAGSTSSAN